MELTRKTEENMNIHNWGTWDKDGDVTPIGCGSEQLAIVFGDNQEVNAQLMASAPELLKELKDIKNLIDAAGECNINKNTAGYKRICATIAKAEGRE